MNKLEEICIKKREHVEEQKSKVSLDDLKSKIKDVEPPRDFKTALKISNEKGHIALIAEIKKASPSKGVIRQDFNPAEIAEAYEIAGASCLSVLTDAPYFQGHDSYFTKVKETVSLPLLRKDFMVDPYQIYESRALGADCILLILTALTDDQVEEMYGIACDLNMDVLAETHDEKEIERALNLSKAIIGVNSRNLKTLDVNLQTALDLAKNIPDHFLKIAESGIKNNDDIQRLEASGYQGFLIGESLMQQENIADATQKILGIG